MIKLFNTLSKTKEEFKPIQSDEVRMYCCGPTVYNYAHIGNLRSFLFEDTLRRVLEYNGYRVKHVMNITDVGHLAGDDGDDTGEDKMLKGARREKKTVWEIAEHYRKAFVEDMTELNWVKPTVLPKATDNIEEMKILIQALEKNGYTYAAGGNIYFNTQKFKHYTDFAQLPPEDETQARVAFDENKKSQRDFALWFTKSKFDDQEMKWPSPWGIGYPGWHIECSAMSMKYLGLHDDITQSETFDIHCGGVDHITVHHTNEIAQSECVTNHKMAKYWLHNEWLVVGTGEKMAKSGDNFITLQTVKEHTIDPLAYRYFTLGAHYRSKLNFTWEALQGAQNAYSRLITLLALSKGVDPFNDEDIDKIDGYKKRFKDSINDDLNTPQALAVVWELLKDDTLSGITKKKLVFEFDKVLGLDLEKRVTEKISEEDIQLPTDVEQLLQQRKQARQDKDWEKSDSLRDQIRTLGFELKDSDDGQVVTRIN